MRNIDGLNNTQEPYNNYSGSILRPQPPQKPRKKRWWKWLLIIVVILGAAAFIYGGTIINKANKIFTGKESIFTRVGKLFVSEDKPLIGEENGRVNILLLGMGGPGHDGPLLTDTIIVASINITSGEVTLISVPRDFMVRYSERGYNKINAAFAFAEQKEEGSGGEASIQQVEAITGLDIPYYMSVDFKGFVKAVDNVGGVDVVVDRTFTDSTYPNYNEGYLPPQTFTKGPAHMDGETALIFARSRHGNNGEGSDFARSERQKKVMLAMKEKLGNLNLTDLNTLNKLLGNFTDNFRTNMEPYELVRLASLAPKINKDAVYSLSLDPQAGIICDGSYDLATGRPAPAPTPVPTPITSPSGTGTSTTPTTTPSGTTPTTTDAAPTSNIQRAYVVVPCSGKTAADIQKLLASLMQTASLQKEAVKIEIQNSTGKPGALNKVKTLTSSQIETKIGIFKGKTPYEKTIIYDNTKGAKPNSLDYLVKTYGFSKADVDFPGSTADIVIILGNDALQ